MRLICSKDAFCLHGNANQAADKVSLKEVSLFVRRIKSNPSVQLAHTKALQHETANYPLRQVQLKTFTVPQGNMTINKENSFLGQQPTRILLAAIENEVFNGIIAKITFNFKLSNINFVAIYRDGVLILKMIDLFAATCVYLDRLVNIIAILDTVFLVSSIKRAATFLHLI